jgi:hypothetical protein
MENLHLVTDEVNRAKGTMTIEEFVMLCCDVASIAKAKTSGLSVCGSLSEKLAS